MTTPKRFSFIFPLHTQSVVKSLKRISPKISHFISLQGTVLQAERNWPHCGRIYALFDESFAYGITSLLFFVFFFLCLWPMKDVTFVSVCVFGLYRRSVSMHSSERCLQSEIPPVWNITSRLFALHYRITI